MSQTLGQQRRAVRNRVHRYLEEHAVQAFTGRAVPRLGPSEKEVIAARTLAREAWRPTGGPPQLAQRCAQENRWDGWEWFDETGKFTSHGQDRGLRMGPLVAWSAG